MRQLLPKISLKAGWCTVLFATQCSDRSNAISSASTIDFASTIKFSFSFRLAFCLSNLQTYFQVMLLPRVREAEEAGKDQKATRVIR